MQSKQERKKWHREENPIALFDVNEPIKYVQNGKNGRKEVTTAYPFGFAPTFHRYRLGEPAKMKNPQNIFVVSMGDLFGTWVPDKWIQEVFRACEAAPWHRYLFLTKNPRRYWELNQLGMLPHDNNFWFGFTITNQRQLELRSQECGWMNKNTFVSIEPLHESVNVLIEPRIRWVIIGAESGNRKNKVAPKREWIERIVEQCRAAGVPVFMKDSLIPIMGEGNMIRELPWEV